MNQYSDNLISTSFTEKDQADLVSKLNEIRKSLPFMISLSTTERLQLAKPSSDMLGAIDSLIAMVETHHTYFPSAIVSVEEMKKDMALVKLLVPLTELAQSIADGLNDTISAAKSDLYRTGIKAYTVAKMINRDVPGIEASLTSMKEVLDRPSRKKKEEK